jgi:hypothetical protein
LVARAELAQADQARPAAVAIKDHRYMARKRLSCDLLTQPLRVEGIQRHREQRHEPTPCPDGGMAARSIRSAQLHPRNGGPGA